jgi:hypothetical protein
MNNKSVAKNKEKTKTLLQWWNAPSELEEELDEDEEED